MRDRGIVVGDGGVRVVAHHDVAPSLALVHRHKGLLHADHHLLVHHLSVAVLLAKRELAKPAVLTERGVLQDLVQGGRGVSHDEGDVAAAHHAKRLVVVVASHKREVVPLGVGQGGVVDEASEHGEGTVLGHATLLVVPGHVAALVVRVDGLDGGVHGSGIGEHLM